MEPSSFYFCDHILDELEVTHEPHFHPDERRDVVPFRLQRQIAKGSFGSVYECSLCCSDFKMAAKIIPRKKNDVSQEVAIARMIRHRGIVTFYDVVTYRDVYLLLMEYVPGQDLFSWDQEQRRYSQKERLPVESFRERIFILKELLDVAIYLLENRIVHRDWKLENVLYCSQSKTIKVCDFGLAVFIRNAQEKLTQACGSLHYVSPEVVNHQAYQAESSTAWSLGVFIFVLLMRCYPFHGKSSDQIRLAISSGQYKRVHLKTVFEFPETSGNVQQWLCADLIRKIFSLETDHRLSLQAIREHPFFNMDSPPLIHCLQRRQPLRHTGKKKKNDSMLRRAISLPQIPELFKKQHQPKEKGMFAPFKQPFIQVQNRFLLVMKTLLLHKIDLASLYGFTEYQMIQNLYKNYTLTRLLLEKQMKFHANCLYCHPETTTFKHIPETETQTSTTSSSRCCWLFI